MIWNHLGTGAGTGKNSTEQKNNAFKIEFYWKIKGIQNSNKMSLNPLFYHTVEFSHQKEF